MEFVELEEALGLNAEPGCLPEDADLDMDRIAERVQAAGFPCEVEQTGGNTATIYAGEPWLDAEGWTRRAALGGPGWFEGPGWTIARAFPSEFNVGPDDDGEGGMASLVWPLTEDEAVEAILALLRAGA